MLMKLVAQGALDSSRWGAAYQKDQGMIGGLDLSGLPSEKEKGRARR